jgi:hypothetical protein
VEAAQDHTDSICSLSFQYFTLIFHRRSYEGPPLHVSFLKCLENVNSERARQLQLLALPA